MYIGLSGSGSRRRRGFRRRRRKRWPGIFMLWITAGIGTVSLLLALTAVAATEDKAVEAAANAKAEGDSAWKETEKYSGIYGKGMLLGEAVKKPGVPVVVVDPGHGGEDAGCSVGGISEKDVNLAIAERLCSRLKEMGYQVIMARGDDTYIAKERRVEMANFWQADIYVSIHQNFYEDSSVAGIETWYDGSDASRDSRRLARLLHQEAVSATGGGAREIRDDADFCVTGKTAMPACLIETGFLSNPEERGRLLDPAYQDKLTEGIARGIDLYFNPRTLYLTFDDGPSAENTNAVLDILKAGNIKATFFVVGENVRRNPETARRIVEEGHAIGIHCNSHDYNTLYQSVDSYLEDFEEARRTVLEVTGAETRLFRFPGGSINSYDKEVSDGIIQAMTERGYIYFDWNASLEDAAEKTTPAELVVNGRTTTLGRKKVVLLAHDVVYNTVLCRDELLEQFPEYKMEVLTPDVEPVQFAGQTSD